MEKGAYIVHANPQTEFDIQFAIKPDVQDVPEAQHQLYLEIERTLTIIRKLFALERVEMEHYFRQILTLAQAGLVPDNAQPAISLTALQQVKAEIIDKKSGLIKNSYFKTLGKQAFQLGIVPLVTGLLIKLLFYYWPDNESVQHVNTFSHFLFFWASCMLGIWLSFGTRKTVLSFEELTTIEEDRLEPLMRMLFSGSLAMIFSLLFHKQVITITVGAVSSKSIGSDVFVAIIFGVFLGLSEQLLGKKITKKAASVMDTI